jgi:cytochrome c5
VLDAAGVAVSVHSDAHGNFWAKADAAMTSAGVTGARDTSGPKLMKLKVKDFDCNSCHETQPIVAPKNM